MDRDAQANKLKASKLAALLKNYVHVDCLANGADPLIQDALLESIVQTADKRHSPHAAQASSKGKGRASANRLPSSSPSPPDEGLSRGSEAETGAEEKNRGSSDEYESVIDEDEDDLGGGAEPAQDDAGEDEPALFLPSDDESSTSEPVAPPSAQPRRSILDSLDDDDDVRSPGAIAASEDDPMDVDADADAGAGDLTTKASRTKVRGHVDLEQMARTGQAGRVTFLFEKVATISLDEVGEA